MSEGIFTVSHLRHDDAVTLELSGELDIAGVEELESALRSVRASGRRLTVDLSSLEFIDSSGLRIFIGLHNAATTQGFGYTLLPGPPAVQRAFALCGLEQTLAFAR